MIWGFARATDRRGVDIIEHCEVTGIRREGGRVAGAKKAGIAVAGNTSRLATMAGLSLPVESHLLQRRRWTSRSNAKRLPLPWGCR